MVSVQGTVKRGQGTGSKIQGKEQLVYLFASLVFMKLTIVKKRQIFQLYILHLNVLSSTCQSFAELGGRGHHQRDGRGAAGEA